MIDRRSSAKHASFRGAIAQEAKRHEAVNTASVQLSLRLV
jgi:hypothetical protein